MLAGLLFGGLALLATPRTYNPEIVVPIVNLSLSRPGSNASDILQQVVRPVEALMAAIPGVEHTYGMALDDQALVTVRFKVNENEATSFLKVVRQLNSNTAQLPLDLSPPVVQAVSLYDVPLVTLTLSSDAYTATQLRATAINLLTKLQTVPQLGKSWLAGISPSTLQVQLQPQRLAAYGISLTEIRQALWQSNLAGNAGLITTKPLTTPIRVSAKLLSAPMLGELIVGTYNAQPVSLRQLATITSVPLDDTISSYFASKTQKLAPAVTLALARQPGSNGVTVAQAILASLAKLQHTLPTAIKVVVTRNYGADANAAVNTLVEHLMLAIAAVVTILLIFLGWREAAIVALVIPIILFIVLGVGWVAGQTLNRITLFALILSLGLLVDDSIVVIENIHRHLVQTAWTSFRQMIIAAADEIGKPTIIATFTVMLAVLPLGFVSGMMGPFMAPIPFNTIVAMLVSLLIAYTAVPYLAYRWLGKKAAQLSRAPRAAGAVQLTLLQRGYVKLFQPLLASTRRRRSFYLGVVLALMLACLQPLWQFVRPSGINGPLSWLGVALKMLPDDNVNTLLLELDAPIGTAQVVTQAAAQAVGQVVLQHHAVTNYQIFLGQAAIPDFAAIGRGDMLQHGTHFAQIRVNLLDKHRRQLGSHAIAQQLYANLQAVRQQFPTIKLKLFETPPGPPVRSQLEVALSGYDTALLQRLAHRFSTQFYPNIYGVINIDTSLTANLAIYQVQLDHRKTIQLGLWPQQVANEIHTYFTGAVVTPLYATGLLEAENLSLRLPPAARQDPQTLTQLTMLNRHHQAVRLEQLAALSLQPQHQILYTRDQTPVIYITGEMLNSSPIYAVLAAQQQLAQLPSQLKQQVTINGLNFWETPADPTLAAAISWLGEMRLTLDVFRDLGVAFGIALALIYLLLTGFYRSFTLPLIIMGAIPLTIIGVFPGHWLMQQPFTATSMIGVIALAGIVVRNSLLLIDFILERQQYGDDLQVAVLTAATVRLAPITLTALAIILGSAVMLSDPVFGGLAIALIFGTLASTLLTLFVIPLLYYGWAQQHVQR